jgi:thiosulfate dehydrogenase
MGVSSTIRSRKNSAAWNSEAPVFGDGAPDRRVQCCPLVKDATGMPSNSLSLTAVALAIVVLGPGADRALAEDPASVSWTAPEPDRLADDAWGRTVRLGRDLIAHTYTHVGPEVADPARRYAGNNLACQNCHLGAGTQPFGDPLVASFANYPNYRPRSGAVGTIEERIQGCMVRSMNGRKLPPDGPEMVAMVAYLKFLAGGRPVGEPLPGQGPGRMPELDRAADPERGRTVYAQVCAACHGANGEGQRAGAVGDTKGYTVPPLWGADSFNDGAGMNRLIEAANFIHNNMPAGTNWQHPVVSVPDAWDAAAFVQGQPRPHMAGLERDYPNRLEKPVDAPYGPYGDSFPEAQHRVGPFAPIRAAIAALKEKQAAR